MTALEISRVGSFMSKLLSSESFDSFLLEEADIHMAAVFTIDGYLNKDFYDTDVWEDSSQRPYNFMPWSEAREYCRNIIKGSRVPSAFRVTLRLKPEYVIPTAQKGGVPDSTIDALQALLINIRLENQKVTVVTGIAFKTFTLDKSADEAWDNAVKKFLDAKGIEFTEQ